MEKKHNTDNFPQMRSKSKPNKHFKEEEYKIENQEFMYKVTSIPSHRQQRRPVSILKNKKNQVGRIKTINNFWEYGRGESSSSDTPNINSQNTETNFFECRQITNCEFIYAQSEKDNTKENFIKSIGKMFKQSKLAQISAMCALQNQLIIGFSNGVLVLLDIDKLEFFYSNKQFTKNNKPINKLKLFEYEDIKEDKSAIFLMCLSEGLLGYYQIPKFTLVSQLSDEPNIVDFEAYYQNSRPYLATVQKNKELKIFRLKESYQYITKIQLGLLPLAFIVYKDIFLVTYKTHSEYIRIEQKGKEQESVLKLHLWNNNEADQKYNPLPIFDESIQAFVVTKKDYSFYMDL